MIRLYFLIQWIITGMLVICALAGIAKGIIYKSPIDFIAAALLLTALVIGIVQRMKKAA